ncbi:MAG: GTP cyclohydrolase II [Saprospiraceae bacterium]|jgi:GTP cyclohydrolase II|nr:GTP cyclohydrolase II [Saprospiraceae bacterium]
MQESNPIIRQAEALIPTPWGNYKLLAYASHPDEWMPHLALVHENIDFNQPVLIRIHSECITGDLFSSKRCDCGEQLLSAMDKISDEHGILIYLRQEGRGIGIINKLKAYQLQDLGLDTVEANLHLGLSIDARDFTIALALLSDIGVKKVRLLTNNPDKIEIFNESAIELVERVPLVIVPQEENRDYLRVKKERMGHILKF